MPWTAVLLGVLSTAAFTEELTRSTPEPPRVQQPTLELHLQQGRFTVRAEAVALAQVLQAIARQGAMTLVLDAPLAEPISVTLVNLPVEVGLRRLLRGYNFSLVFARRPADARPSPQVTPTQIRVLGKVQGVDLHTPASDVAAQAEGAHSQAEGQAETVEREAAIEFIEEGQGKPRSGD